MIKLGPDPVNPPPYSVSSPSPPTSVSLPPEPANISSAAPPVMKLLSSLPTRVWPGVVSSVTSLPS
ncbi:MAG: hypothetical protein EOP58_03010 [Sphingomonadales bacterium]|nr:MAG: hypothetical protein EOP58_03010 [Sphingomonadales bacterium]